MSSNLCLPLFERSSIIELKLYLIDIKSVICQEQREWTLLREPIDALQ